MLKTKGGRTLLRLWVALVVSQIGTNVSAFGMGVWLYERTHSASFFALLPFATALPSVVLSPFIGHAVDRFGRLRLMLLADTASAVVVGVLALLAHTNHLGIASMVLGAGTLGIFAAAHTGALDVSVPHLVEREHLSRANALLGVARTVPIVAPLIAVAVFATYGLTALLVIDLGTFVFSVLVVIGSHVPSPPSDRRPLEIGAGFRRLREEPGLCALLVFICILNVGMGAIEVLLTPLVLSRYSVSFLGTVMIVSGLGGLAGGALAGVVTSKREVRTIAVLGGLSGVAIAVGTAVDRPIALLVGASVYMACYVLIGALSQTIWQARIAPEWQGRVFLARFAVTSSVVPFAQMASGPAIDRLEHAVHAGGRIEAWTVALFGAGEGRAPALIALALGVVSVAGACWLVRSRPARELESANALP